jgi:cell division protein FtsZ
MATAMGNVMVSQPMVHGATALQHQHEPQPIAQPRMEAPAPVQQPAPQPVAAPPQAEAAAPEAIAEAPAPIAPAPAPAPQAKAEDHFVPPPPVDAKTGVRPQVTRPNPMNEAALVNGGQAPAKRRWTSILEIVANSSRRPARAQEPVIARGASERVAAHATAPEASLPLPEPARPEPPKAEAKAPERPMPAPQQPELGGLDPSQPVQTRGAGDDELLDIPAFLRRQAN